MNLFSSTYRLFVRPDGPIKSLLPVAVSILKQKFIRDSIKNIKKNYMFLILL